MGQFDAPVPGARRAAVWRRYLRFWGQHKERDVDDEIRYHVDMRTRDYLDQGLPEGQARQAAALRFGDMTPIRDECIRLTGERYRRSSRALFIDALGQDVRFAMRSFRRKPVWAAVCVLTLALGIGATASIFSVINGVLLRPVPYPGPERIVLVYDRVNVDGGGGAEVTVLPQPAIVPVWRKMARSLDDIEPFVTKDVTYEPTNGTAALVHGALVESGFSRFAGYRPLLGRSIQAADIDRGERVVALSEAFWRQRFGADSGVVGRAMVIDGAAYHIVGVMPSSLRLPTAIQEVTDLWLPLDLRAPLVGVYVIARLRPHTASAAAALELTSVEARTNPAGSSREAQVIPPGELVHFRDSLELFAASVAFVLLIACANLAHLLLARGVDRRRELAVRAALGAERSRLARQLMTETMVLVSAGLLGALAVASVGVRLLAAFRPTTAAELAAVHLDARAIAVAAATAVATGLVFSLLAFWQSGALAGYSTLRGDTRGASAGRGTVRLRSLLVVSEMALSTVLLICATLLIRTVSHLQALDPGFRSTGLFNVQIDLPASAYPSSRARAAFFDQLINRIQISHELDAATLTGTSLPGQQFRIGAIQTDGMSAPPNGGSSVMHIIGVQPDFFRTVGLAIQQGSTFTDTTVAGAQAIINQGLAKRFWPGASPVGHRLRIVYADQGQWYRIVGVASDAALTGLTANVSDPLLFIPDPHSSTTELLVRTTTPSSAVAKIRSIVFAIDRRVPPPTLGSVASRLSATVANQRFTMGVLVAFATIALLLAALGLYGVMAYSVAQQTREIGIRMALGASRMGVGRATIGQGLSIGLAGLVLGLIVARSATAALSSVLIGVSPYDGVAFLVSGVVLVIATLLACIVPMQRAVSVDPLLALRAE